MNIPLNKSYRDWIEAAVRSGRYASEIEAIEDAIREKIEHDEVERLRERIRESERQIERGEVVVADEAYFESKRRRIRERFIEPGG